MKTTYTTGEVAELLGTTTTRVRALFKTGTLPEPPKHGHYRAIPKEMIADIAQALRDRGWMPTATEVAS